MSSHNKGPLHEGQNQDNELRRRSDDAEIFDNEILEQEWMTSKEAAEYLRISVSELMNMCSNGMLRYYKLGRRNRYLRRDLKAQILQNRRGGFYDKT